MSIKAIEPYSVTHARNWVRDSLQYHGEQCILLQIYHPTKDDPNKLRCPNCADDIYTQGSNDCPICFGVGYFGGVRQALRVWALFSDTRHPESQTQRGVWVPDAREIQTEAFPQLFEHDYVARVRIWGGPLATPVPEELEGIYGIGEVTPDSMRTGARFGQARWDVIGQRAPITKLQHNVRIGDFPTIGQSFPEPVPPLDPRVSFQASPLPVTPVPPPQPPAPPQGPSTAVIISGAGPPSSTMGNPGDFYIDTTTDTIYGPKQE